MAEFDATRGIEESGWKASHDKPNRAGVISGSGILRIEDEESGGQLEDAYYYFEMDRAERAKARSSGFVYQWSLRIPADTGGSTRAISTEVCIEGAESESRLRFGLQFGRRGTELVASVDTGSDGPIQRWVKVDDVDAFHDWTLVFDGKSQVLNLLLDRPLIVTARIDRWDQGHHLVFGSRSTGEGISEWKRVRFLLGTDGHKVTEPPPSASPRFWIMAREQTSVQKRIDVFTGGTDGYCSRTQSDRDGRIFACV